MRRFACVLVVLAAGVVVGVSSAAAPTQLKEIDVSDSFVIPDLCSFPVTVTISGTANVTLWTNSAGAVVRELDTAPGSTSTFSGNGNSFSFPNSLVARTDYGSGAALGGSATVTLSGLFGHVPGFLSSDAGRQVIVNATVVGFASVQGVEIPLTDGGDVSTQSGHFNSGDAIGAAICGALT